GSWSDGGAQLHNIVVPNADATYTATYTAQNTGPPAFVQGTSRQITSGVSNAVDLPQTTTQGNLVVAYVVWDNTDAVSVTDSNGNTDAPAAARTTWASGWSAQTFYAKNIAGGVDTVTATFTTGISSFGIVYLHEYSGLDTTNPIDVTSAATGTTAAI